MNTGRISFLAVSLLIPRYSLEQSRRDPIEQLHRAIDEMNMRRDNAEWEAAQKRYAEYQQREFYRRLVDLETAVSLFRDSYEKDHGLVFSVKKAEAIKKAYRSLVKIDARFDTDK